LADVGSEINTTQPQVVIKTLGDGVYATGFFSTNLSSSSEQNRISFMSSSQDNNGQHEATVTITVNGMEPITLTSTNQVPLSIVHAVTMPADVSSTIAQTIENRAKEHEAVIQQNIAAHEQQVQTHMDAVTQKMNTINQEIQQKAEDIQTKVSEQQTTLENLQKQKMQIIQDRIDEQEKEQVNRLTQLNETMTTKIQSTNEHIEGNLQNTQITVTAPNATISVHASVSQGN
jgi:vacuolar-type H+-ATPase subunit I/STV1